MEKDFFDLFIKEKAKYHFKTIINGKEKTFKLNIEKIDLVIDYRANQKFIARMIL